LNATDTLIIQETAVLSSRGSESPKERVGGGSGGAIVLEALNFYYSGYIDVQGGNSTNKFSSAGGGGRVALKVSLVGITLTLNIFHNC
jgi:hypothetical protein